MRKIIYTIAKFKRDVKFRKNYSENRRNYSRREKRFKRDIAARFPSA